jgi:hypothetical protein
MNGWMRRLESVALDGSTAFYGPVSADFPAVPTAVDVSSVQSRPYVNLTAGAALGGIALLALAAFGKRAR